MGIGRGRANGERRAELSVESTGFGAEGLLFLRQFLRSPRTVGAIAPSSRFLSRAMVAGLESAEGCNVAEFGPGTGSFTAVLAATLPPGARYLGIERDSVFTAGLRRRFPGLSFVCDSVENILEVARASCLLPLDAVISGLPFASLPRSVTRSILDGLAGALRDGGSFTTFQYVHAFGFPAAIQFRREMRCRFGPPVSRKFVPMNLPTAFVLRWRKKAAGGPQEDR